LTAIAGTI